jgi:hypothetical protein
MRRLARIAAGLCLAGSAWAGDVALVVRGVVQSASVQSGPFFAATPGDAVELRLEAWLPGNPITPGQYVSYPLDLANSTLMVGGVLVNAGSIPVSVGFANNYGGVDGVRLFGLPLAAGAQPVAFEFSECTAGIFSSVDPSANPGTYAATQWCSYTFAVQGPGANLDIAPLDLAISLPSTGSPYCFGDGTGASCPCGNSSSMGSSAGCLHSLGGAGRLRASGVASVSTDSLVLRGEAMPSSSALYFQGTSRSGGGLGVAFGDGLRCAGGVVVRLGTKANVVGASLYPAAGDLPVSSAGLVAPGDVRTYQIWYRNAASYCTASVFNLTNGLELTWAP